MPVSLHLKITSTPLGEAPLWVREKWIGLSIPLAQSSVESSSFLTLGVLSNSTGFWACVKALLRGQLRRETGFLVESKLAVDLLSIAAPEAAQWWRENTPYLLRPEQLFVFDSRCGHIEEVEQAL